MNPDTNRLEILRSEEDADRLRRRFEAKVAAIASGGRISPEEAQAHMQAGPPQFTEGEVIVVRGYPFTVHRISPRKITLKPAGNR